jgi:hypothetical protein
MAVMLPMGVKADAGFGLQSCSRLAVEGHEGMGGILSKLAELITKGSIDHGK